MENQQDNSKGAPLAAWIFLRARAALAVALIKNRPPGMSGREHAEALGRTLRSQDESWKKKAQELQQEVLRLRQELLITRMMSDTKSSTEAAGQYSPMDVSQDLFGQEDMACSSDLQPSRNSETPELMLQDPQSGPNPPQPPATASLQENPGCRSGLPHAHFLQSLCALHRVEGSRGLESLWFCSDKDAVSLLVESVCQLLDSVVSACRDPLPLGPSDLVLQGCQVASRAMDLFCSQRLPSVEFTKRVEDSLKELTGMLLNSHRFSGLQAAEKLTEYLITLGSSSMSKSSLIRHILSEISALADQLWQAFQDQGSSGLDGFPVDQYQNSCFLFWVVEQLLQRSKVPCRVGVGSDQSGFFSHLEQRVFLLSSEFPLFSLYMWRIGGLLTSSDRP
ncbi:meiosis-specific protein MEI4 isoform X2 [Cheilinus undulatus]|uniref:meiosis-specific protein MEI4 isoform X2 n=1 Tax=Cheilinus undulatus TaxID=241271 RepID=UPI001BD5261B|nr:meiosis-specific protein MEI4 isoform X2 [Cheilinus undulatus]